MLICWEKITCKIYIYIYIYNVRYAMCVQYPQEFMLAQLVTSRHLIRDFGSNFVLHQNQLVF